MRLATYKNPFHSEKYHGSKPIIETDAKPLEYKGFVIYERIRGSVWDVVKNGSVVTMRAGLNGAKQFIDQL